MSNGNDEGIAYVLLTVHTIVMLLVGCACYAIVSVAMASFVVKMVALFAPVVIFWLFVLKEMHP